MHIAFLIRSLSPGGAERAAVSLANEMARKGHKTTILCMTGTECFYDADPNVIIRYLNLKSIECESGLTRLTSLFCRSREIRDVVREIHPDVLVGMSWMMSVYAALCTQGTSVVSIGTERSNPFILNDSRVNSALRKFASVHCDGFVCQTDKARSFFPKRVQKKIRIIQNGVFNPDVYNTSVPNERDKTITALGRLDHNKGYDLLLDAFRIVLASHPAYRLRIFGDGELHEELQARADSLGIADNVDFCGTDAHALFPIAASSVFVLSSRSEGMPNALIEAMAAGVPCVSTRCEMGPEELIEDGVNGLLVPMEDAHALASAIGRILDDPILSHSLSDAALRLRETHDPTATAERWLAYFGEFLC